MIGHRDAKVSAAACGALAQACSDDSRCSALIRGGVLARSALVLKILLTQHFDLTVDQIRQRECAMSLFCSISHAMSMSDLEGASYEASFRAAIATLRHLVDDRLAKIRALQHTRRRTSVDFAAEAAARAAGKPLTKVKVDAQHAVGWSLLDSHHSWRMQWKTMCYAAAGLMLIVSKGVHDAGNAAFDQFDNFFGASSSVRAGRGKTASKRDRRRVLQPNLVADLLRMPDPRLLPFTLTLVWSLAQNRRTARQLVENGAMHLLLEWCQVLAQLPPGKLSERWAIDKGLGQDGADAAPFILTSALNKLTSQHNSRETAHENPVLHALLRAGGVGTWTLQELALSAVWVLCYQPRGAGVFLAHHGVEMLLGIQRIRARQYRVAQHLALNALWTAAISEHRVVARLLECEAAKLTEAVAQDGARSTVARLTGAGLTQFLYEHDLHAVRDQLLTCDTSVANMLFSIIATGNAQGQEQAALMVAHACGRAEFKSSVSALRGATVLIKLLRTTEHKEVAQACLHALLNLTTDAANQVEVCSVGLRVLLDFATVPEFPEFQAMSSKILQNLRTNPSNRTSMYQAELEVKGRILRLARTRASCDSHSDSGPKVAETLARAFAPQHHDVTDDVALIIRDFSKRGGQTVSNEVLAQRAEFVRWVSEIGANHEHREKRGASYLKGKVNELGQDPPKRVYQKASNGFFQPPDDDDGNYWRDILSDSRRVSAAATPKSSAKSSDPGKPSRGRPRRINGDFAETEDALFLKVQQACAAQHNRMAGELYAIARSIAPSRDARIPALAQHMRASFDSLWSPPAGRKADKLARAERALHQHAKEKGSAAVKSRSSPIKREPVSVTKLRKRAAREQDRARRRAAKQAELMKGQVPTMADVSVEGEGGVPRPLLDAMTASLVGTTHNRSAGRARTPKAAGIATILAVRSEERSATEDNEKRDEDFSGTFLTSVSDLGGGPKSPDGSAAGMPKSPAAAAALQRQDTLRLLMRVQSPLVSRRFSTTVGGHGGATIAHTGVALASWAPNIRSITTTQGTEESAASTERVEEAATTPLKRLMQLFSPERSPGHGAETSRRRSQIAEVKSDKERRLSMMSVSERRAADAETAVKESSISLTAMVKALRQTTVERVETQQAQVAELKMKQRMADGMVVAKAYAQRQQQQQLTVVLGPTHRQRVTFGRPDTADARIHPVETCETEKSTGVLRNTDADEGLQTPVAQTPSMRGAKSPSSRTAASTRTFKSPVHAETVTSPTVNFSFPGSSKQKTAKRTGSKLRMAATLMGRTGGLSRRHEHGNLFSTGADPIDVSASPVAIARQLAVEHIKPDTAMGESREHARELVYGDRNVSTAQAHKDRRRLVDEAYLTGVDPEYTPDKFPLPPALAELVPPEVEDKVLSAEELYGLKGKKPSQAGIKLCRFEHIDGSTVCESLYRHYTAPDGRTYHFHVADELHEIVAEAATRAPRMPTRFDDIFQKGLPRPPTAVWPSVADMEQPETTTLPSRRSPADLDDVLHCEKHGLPACVACRADMNRMMSDPREDILEIRCKRRPPLLPEELEPEWDIETSCFEQRLMGSCLGYYDGEKNVRNAAMLDWRRILGFKGLAFLITGEDDFTEEHKKSLRPVFLANFEPMWHTYLYHCIMSKDGDGSTLTVTGWLDCLRACNISNEKSSKLSLAAQAKFFATSGGGLKERLTDSTGDEERTYVRHEFLALLLHVAVIKYLPRGAANMTLGDALEKLCVDNIVPNVPEEMRVDPDEFRRDFLYHQKVAWMFETNERTIKQLYADSASTKVSKSLGVGVTDWCNLLQRTHLYTRSFTRDMARMIFKWSKPRVVDELHYRQAQAVLSYTDFLEALARTADLLNIPTRGSLLRAGVLSVREWNRQAEAKAPGEDSLAAAEDSRRPLHVKIYRMLDVMVGHHTVVRHGIPQIMRSETEQAAGPVSTFMSRTHRPGSGNGAPARSPKGRSKGRS